MGLPPLFKIFTLLLLLTTYCKSQPVEFITDVEFKTDDTVTTICPEEAVTAQEDNLPPKIDDVNKLGFVPIASSDSEETTICPEEIERQKQKETLNENLAKKQPEESLSSEKQVDPHLNQLQLENSEETATTICPEELEKRKLEKNDVTNLNAIENDNLTPSKEITTSYPEELEKINKENVIKISDSRLKTVKKDNFDKSEETTTICPEELQKINEEKNNAKLNSTLNNLEDNLLKTVDNLDVSMETTICPEELEKMKQEKIEDNSKDNNILKTVDNLDLSMETTICPEELEKLDRERDNSNTIPDQTDGLREYNIFETLGHNTDSDPPKETFENLIEDSTTICPKELARRKLEQSQKYLTKFKELVDKAQKRKTFRRKRQADYSYYSMNQPAYNAEGLAMSGANAKNNVQTQHQSNYNPQGYNIQGQTSLSTKQNQQSYKPQMYNSQSYSPQPVKTYQQIRKQYQPGNNIQKNPSLYSKTYQNNIKPVKTYRNPSTYVRYPSNGNLQNYYKLNNVGNRRQFQGARPLPSTSARPRIRVTRKKKFKPSPVFA